MLCFNGKRANMKKYYKHQLFLTWLVYIVSVISIVVLAGYFGIIQMGFALDKSHLSEILTGFYVLSEVYLGYLVIKTSRELTYSHDIGKFLDHTPDAQFKLENDVVVVENTTGKTQTIKPSFLAEHITNLIQRSQHWTGKKKKLDQGLLLDAISDRIHDSNNYSQHALMIILFSGFIGTVIGIIWTFLPFMDPNNPLDLTNIQAHLPTVFGGVGAAFFPSAFSAVYSLFMLFNDRLLSRGSNDLTYVITTISETHVVPVLEKNNE
jgi:hypothetical protein